jgi:hypothetical protein
MNKTPSQCYKLEESPHPRQNTRNFGQLVAPPVDELPYITVHWIRFLRKNAGLLEAHDAS